MKLTEDEVIQILKLVEESRFGEFHLEMGDLKLHVRKGGGGGVDGPAAPSQIVVPSKPVTEMKKEAQSPGTMLREEKVPTIPEENLVPIKAPMLGTFYRRPSPGAPSYVEVGTFVKEDETVCLLEVMKVFNSVKA